MIDTSELKFLEEYVNTASPSGHEESGQKLWLQNVKPFIDDHMVDMYGSVAGIINPGKDFKVVLEAHVDQIAFYVNYINEKGYIFVTKIGGEDPVVAPSKTLNIHTEKGAVPGVFGWPAIHVRNNSQNTPDFSNIFIETGCTSKEEVLALGIDIRCPVTFSDTFKVLNNTHICGPALDNKIGGFILLQIAKRLKKENVQLPYSLFIVNSVLEETGKSGAIVMGNNICPDVAIITDVTHDTQAPMYDKKKFGDISIGKGPVLSMAPTVQKNLLKMLMQVADSNHIKYQKKANSTQTGTDTDSFAFSDSGVASALVAMPLKYMHTTAETVHMQDVENTIELIFQFLVQLKEGHDFRYLT